MELIIACCIAIHDNHVTSYNIIASRNQPPFSCGSRTQVALKSTLFTGKEATLGQTKNNYGWLAVLQLFYNRNVMD